MTWWYSLVSLLPFEWAAPGTMLFMKNALLAVLVISPEHAATMYRDMKSKDAIRDYLVKNTVLPYKFYTKATCVPPEAFGPYDANTLIPRFTQRESIKMIVSGGPGKQSQFWVPFPQVLKPVSAKIAE